MMIMIIIMIIIIVKIIIVIMIMKWNKNSNNCLQMITIVLIFRIGMGFPKDHGSLVIKSHTSNDIQVAY